MTIPEAFAVLCFTTLLGLALVGLLCYGAECAPRDNIDAGREFRGKI